VKQRTFEQKRAV